ncbi:hypothetical protein HMPREF3230_00593 [Gardnerella vaginalis]|uniref:DNA-binding protein n=1 Tax=Gardnerella vaginalis TaxID=2702 RepID=A0A135Z859_GARVA|nr:hypothetical protein HMPREF3230_00593 [Gardnerella vaginalis]
MNERYLSYTEVAKLICVKTSTLDNYDFPDPDAFIGRTHGCKGVRHAPDGSRSKLQYSHVSNRAPCQP